MSDMEIHSFMLQSKDPKSYKTIKAKIFNLDEMARNFSNIQKDVQCF